MLNTELKFELVL